MAPIVLLTDFGQVDPFVGIMKGVILTRQPQAPVLDLTHEIPPQDVRMAAFTLMVSVPYFPPGSIFVCVVDPGVGSDRRILWARSGKYQFLCPDNGLIAWTERRLSFDEVRHVTNRQLALPNLSSTFHGRDIFAPVAAELSKGISPEQLGPVITDFKRLPYLEPITEKARIVGSIIAIDRFGNAITNLTMSHVKNDSTIRFGRRKLGEIRSHYTSVEPDCPLALVGSFGFVELAVRNGSFARAFTAAVGDTVEALVD